MSSTLPPASLSELQAEMVALLNKIQGEEDSIAQLRNTHPTLPDAMLQLEEQIARTRSSVVASKQRFYRLVHAHAAHAGTLSVYFLPSLNLFPGLKCLSCHPHIWKYLLFSIVFLSKPSLGPVLQPMMSHI
jgi:hypothetical protein